MAQDKHSLLRSLRTEDSKLKEYGLAELPPPGAYTHRERYRRIMHFQSVDRVPNHEFGYWDDTLVRWHDEGLPKEVDSNWAADVFFGFDPTSGVPIHMGVTPGWTHEVLETTDRYQIVRGGDGVKCMVYTDGSSSIPHYIEFPLKNREDWEQDFKRRLDPDDPSRYTVDWDAVRKNLEGRDIPAGIGFGSLFGWIRNWMGFEGVSYACYDDPALIEEIMERITVMLEKLLNYSLEQYSDLDFASGWEDMCFDHGPIISPKMFKEWMVPRYKRLTDILHKYGIDVVITDCDGNINELVGLWIEGGVNCMFPLKINSGTLPEVLRAKYGQQVLLAGGVDKIQLARGKKEIEKEIERLRPTVETGGFIPHVDHRVPPDVSYENYLYYLKLKRQAFCR